MILYSKLSIYKLVVSLKIDLQHFPLQQLGFIMALKVNSFFFFAVLIVVSLQQNPVHQHSTSYKMVTNSTTKESNSSISEQLLALVPSNNKPAPVMRAQDVLNKDDKSRNISSESNQKVQMNKTKDKEMEVLRQQKEQLIKQSQKPKTNEVQKKSSDQESRKFGKEVKSEAVVERQSSKQIQTNDKKSKMKDNNKKQTDEIKGESKLKSKERQQQKSKGSKQKVQQKLKTEEKRKEVVQILQQSESENQNQQKNVKREYKRQKMINNITKPSTMSELNNIKKQQQKIVDQQLAQDEKIMDTKNNQNKIDLQVEKKVANQSEDVQLKQKESKQLNNLQNLQVEFSHQQQQKQKMKQKQKQRGQQQTELKITKISEQFKSKEDEIVVNKQIQKKDNPKQQKIIKQEPKPINEQPKKQTYSQKNETKESKLNEKQRSEQKQNNIKIVPLSPDYGKSQSAKNVGAEAGLSPSLSKQKQKDEKKVEEQVNKTKEAETSKQILGQVLTKQSKIVGNKEKQQVKSQKVVSIKQNQMFEYQKQKRSEQQKIKQLIKQVNNSKDSLGENSKKEIIKYLQAQIKSSQKRQVDANVMVQPKLVLQLHEEPVLLHKQTDRQQLTRQPNQQMDSTTIIVIIILTFIISIPIVRELRYKNIGELIENKLKEEQARIPSKSDLQKPENSREYDLANSSLYEVEERLDQEII